MYDPDNPTTYLDGREFAEYCLAVRECIAKHKKPTTIGYMRKAMDKAYRPEWTADALERLHAAGAIRQMSTIRPTKYIIDGNEPRQITPKWNRSVQTAHT